MSAGRWRTPALTAAALVGFAANSILCRMALQPGLIDAATFTTVRLLSGALVLLLLHRVAGRAARPVGAAGSWTSAAALFAYAIAFSFAYVRIGAAVGALLLFGAVQATMLAWAIRSGERLHPLQWLGLAVAMGGLVLLVLPGLTAPDPLGSGLMLLAGVAWGVYSLRARGVSDPLAATASNFARTVPLTLASSLVAAGAVRVTARGAALAIVSGALASGVGYTFWYAALRGLTASRAAVLQLLVPVLAAGAAVVLLGEFLTARLVLATAAIVGGVARATLKTATSPRR